MKTASKNSIREKVFDKIFGLEISRIERQTNDRIFNKIRLKTQWLIEDPFWQTPFSALSDAVNRHVQDRIIR